MTFRPDPHDTLTVDGVSYAVAEHPSAPGMPHGQEGRAGTVYHLLPSLHPPAPQGGGGKAAGEWGEGLALKVFKPRFRLPYLVSQAQRIAALADLPGLSACRRSVLTPFRHAELLNQYSDLTYAVLMPWIEGPTWLEVLVEKQPFTPQQSLALGRALATVLARMEEQGIAHCDLSAPNVMLPALVSADGVELIDLEGLYAPGLTQPNALSSGSAGYAHREAAGGLWRPEADRFAGAVLLAEMLGWCDPQVVQAAWGGSYFDPGEVQQDSPRSRALLASLRRHWGAGAAALFERAWRSDSLADCPTFGEWLVALPQAVVRVAAAESSEAPLAEGDEESSVHDTTSVVAEIRILLQAGRRMEEKGSLQGAEELYRQALELAQGDPAAGGLAKEIELLLQELRRRQRARAAQAAPAPAPEPLPAPSPSSLDRPPAPVKRPGARTWLAVGSAASVLFALGLCVVLVVLGLGGKGPLAALASCILTSTPTLTHTPTPTPTLTHTPTPTPTLTPIPTMLDVGSTWLRPADGMVMVYVPEGEFTMGSPQGVGDDDEHPQHPVYLDAFWIDRTEVTNAMFVQFLNSIAEQVAVEANEFVNFDGNLIYDLICTGCNRWTDRITWNGSRFGVVSGYEDHPVAQVTWYGAQEYCAWAGARLPSEAEWEKAARGTDGRSYPWGDDFDCTKGNFDDETSLDSDVVPGGAGCDGYERTSPVGIFHDGQSPYGALDMAGNVWEWVNDWYSSSYYSSSPYSNPPGPASGGSRVLRGGSWNNDDVDLRSAYRIYYGPAAQYDRFGFRCARLP